MMEQLRRIRAELQARFDRLQPRERLWVTAAAAVFVAVVIFTIAARFSGYTGAMQLRIAEKTRVLSQVGHLAEGYRRAQAERQALEARLKAPPVPLMTHVSQTGQTFGIEVGDLRPSGNPEETEGIVAESVEVSLPRIDPAKLGRFLQALEGGQGVVRVRRVRMATRSDDPKVVDATVVVSNFQLKG